MNTQLMIAIITIISALLFYTIGVWSVKFTSRLKPWHLLLFWIGFILDTTSTSLMTNIAGKFVFDFHGIIGLLALLLMLGNAVWATIVLRTREEKQVQKFTKFSVFVWLIWLIPFFTGMIGAMKH